MGDRTFGGSVAAFGMVLLGSSLGHAATNVVTCTPTTGLTSTATASPAMPVADGPFGIKLATTLDGCAANASQLAAWVPSKNGIDAVTAAAVAKAAISLKTKGYGTCNFTASDPAAYTANGTLSIKWLTSAGATSKMKGSTAYVRLSGDLATVSADLDGVVTKGTGVGAPIHASVGFDLANPINAAVLGCNTGTPIGPVSQIALVTTATSTLSIDFP
jgi:hypothetical protein